VCERHSRFFSCPIRSSGWPKAGPTFSVHGTAVTFDHSAGFLVGFATIHGWPGSSIRGQIADLWRLLRAKCREAADASRQRLFRDFPCPCSDRTLSSGLWLNRRLAVFPCRLRGRRQPDRFPVIHFLHLAPRGGDASLRDDDSVDTPASCVHAVVALARCRISSAVRIFIPITGDICCRSHIGALRAVTIRIDGLPPP
jgi:hypothetical protein